MPMIRERQSSEYRRRREALLAAEAALTAERERVAALRRELGAGTPVGTDYVFREGPADLARNAESDFFDTRLSDLFGGRRELVVQHMMFGATWEKGCPMCSMWADGLDGVAHHLADRMAFVVVARAPLAVLRAWGRARGWRRLRLLSSHDNDFNRDFGTELGPDRQLPALSVFTRDADGVRHFYTTEGSLAERHHRAMDLFTPVWNVLDLLPGGRGDWMPRHSYQEER
jgi:predicted dithiol-disulfide oxidoreductase (DUF899 family)